MLPLFGGCVRKTGRTRAFASYEHAIWLPSQRMRLLRILYSYQMRCTVNTRGRLSSRSRPWALRLSFVAWRAASSRWGHGASRSRRACWRAGAAQDVYSDFDCGRGRGRPRWVELGRAVRASTGSAQVSRAGACPFRPGRRACRSGRSCSRSPLPLRARRALRACPPARPARSST